MALLLSPPSPLAVVRGVEHDRSPSPAAAREPIEYPEPLRAVIAALAQPAGLYRLDLFAEWAYN
jgi:hypothetical protein